MRQVVLLLLSLSAALALVAFARSEVAAQTAPVITGYCGGVSEWDWQFLLDGDLRNAWTCGSGWLQFDLGASQPLRSFRWDSDGNCSLSVSVSNDATYWTGIYSGGCDSNRVGVYGSYRYIQLGIGSWYGYANIRDVAACPYLGQCSMVAGANWIKVDSSLRSFFSAPIVSGGIAVILAFLLAGPGIDALRALVPGLGDFDSLLFQPRQRPGSSVRPVQGTDELAAKVRSRVEEDETWIVGGRDFREGRSQTPTGEDLD